MVHSYRFLNQKIFFINEETMNTSYKRLFFICILALFVIAASSANAQNTSDTTQTASVDSLKATTPAFVNHILETLSASKPSLSWSLTLGKLVWCIGIFLISFLVLKYLTLPLERLSQRHTRIGNYLTKLIPFIRILFWTGVLYILVVGVIAPPGQTFFILVAVIGITLGISMQGFLKNILGGIVILLERPFKLKDKIMIREHYGEIVHMGLRSIKIQTLNKAQVIIPNSEVLSNCVVNRNAGKSICQVNADFYLPPDSNIAEAKKVAYRAASVSRYVYLNEPIAVTTKNEVHDGNSFLKVTVTAHVLDIKYETLFISELTEIVMDTLYRGKIIPPQALVYSQENEKRVG